MVTYEQMKRFCADDCLRAALMEPHKVDRWWCASNSYILIYDEEVLFDEKCVKTTDGKFPNVLAVFNPDNFRAEGSLTLERLNISFDAIPRVEVMREVSKPFKLVNCPSCNDGEIEISDDIRYRNKYYEATATVECPICHGYGKIPDTDKYDPENDYPESFELTEEIHTGEYTFDRNACLSLWSPMRASLVYEVKRLMEETGYDSCEVMRKKMLTIFHFGTVYIAIMGMVTDKKTEI